MTTTEERAQLDRAKLQYIIGFLGQAGRSRMPLTPEQCLALSLALEDGTSVRDVINRYNDMKETGF